jgi:nitrate reductase beta subunit
VLDAVGLGPAAADAMYRLLALAYHSERFVIPTASRPEGANLYTEQGSCGYPQ